MDEFKPFGGANEQDSNFSTIETSMEDLFNQFPSGITNIEMGDAQLRVLVGDLKNFELIPDEDVHLINPEIVVNTGYGKSSLIINGIARFSESVYPTIADLDQISLNYDYKYILSKIGPSITRVASLTPKGTDKRMKIDNGNYHQELRELITTIKRFNGKLFDYKGMLNNAPNRNDVLLLKNVVNSPI